KDEIKLYDFLCSKDLLYKLNNNYNANDFTNDEKIEFLSAISFRMSVKIKKSSLDISNDLILLQNKFLIDILEYILDIIDNTIMLMKKKLMEKGFIIQLNLLYIEETKQILISDLEESKKF